MIQCGVEQPPHVLIVGGTGMLRGLSLALAQLGYLVSVVARRRKRLLDLAKTAEARHAQIHPMAVDVYDTAALSVALQDAISRLGSIALVVDWASPNGSLDVARIVGSAGQPCQYFHLLGSSAADPSRADPERRTRFEALPTIRYHEVILGFVRQATSSRWLTHEEICHGVWRAIEQGPSYFIIGTVEPWSARPC